MSDQPVSDQPVSDQPDRAASPHGEDEVREQQRDLARADRRGRADGGGASAAGTADEDQSAYSTEVEQGAAQPGPDHHSG